MMNGQKEIIQTLNKALANELTAINQYFLHARILQDWGLEKIGELEYKASLDEMKHADDLIKRILFLEGLPNMQKLGHIRVGQNIKEILESDLELEMMAIPTLKESIELSEKFQDYVSRDLFTSILNSEEDHVDWLETQLGLLEKVGIERYMQSQISMDSS